MADIRPMQEGEYTTVLGPDCTIRGELTFEKGVKVEGRFEGKVNTQGRLLIGKTAELNAEINAGTVLVEGRINGNVAARDRLDLAASARLFGDIVGARLTVADGATFVGHCQVGPDATKGEHKSAAATAEAPKTANVAMPVRK